MPRTLFAVIICLTISGFFPWLSTADELTECDPEPTSMAIDVGEIIGCKISPAGDADIFRFNGRPGDVIELTISDLTRDGTAHGTRPSAQVFDPDNNLLATLTANDAGTSQQLLLSSLGTYTVIVAESGNNQVTNYNIALQRLFPAPPEAQTLCYGCIINESISPIADSDVFLFHGTNGDTILLTLTDLTRDGTAHGTRPSAQVFDPNNNLLATLNANDAGTSQRLLLTNLTYTVIVAESGNNQVTNYNIALECVSGNCLTVPISTCDVLNATLIGTDGDNIITGTAGDDVIQGLGGNDTIYGLGGNDVICGGDGNDIILAGDGDDIVLGNDGNDVIEGGPGNDELIGGAGHNVLSGGMGNDILLGGSGNDSLNGDEDDDELTGGIGSDVCDGGPHSMGDIALESCDLTVDVP